MNYATIKKFDIADGLGVRVSIFVSGCTHRCKGCFNEIAWPFDYGEKYTEQVEEEILEACGKDYIEGLTLLGGEPFELINQEGLISLLRKFKAMYPQKNIWAYSGYTLDKDILPKEGKVHGKVTEEMLSYIDVLVDGKFIEELKDISLRFRGSSNQRLIDLKKTIKEQKIILLDM
ncbi:MAG: anaerobic ribonucleoside-triphosphate reductase activating protein [Bacillales bacterium]|nr:anaerobic ribonucleoside-triphosphate reductase activating protein [Bacillales bacterium]